MATSSNSGPVFRLTVTWDVFESFSELRIGVCQKSLTVTWDVFESSGKGRSDVVDKGLTVTWDVFELTQCERCSAEYKV